jgi:hypothetical protein
MAGLGRYLTLTNVFFLLKVEACNLQIYLKNSTRFEWGLR